MSIAEQPSSFETESLQAMSLQDYFAGVKRRRKPILWTAGGILFITVLLAVLWPPSYTASATILIEEQEIPQDMIRSTVTSYAFQQIETIRARVLTLENIMQVVRKHELYSEDELAVVSRSEIQRDFIDAIDLELLNAEIIDPHTGKLVNAVLAFTLSFEASQPDIAFKVTNELANLFLAENLRTRTEKTSSTAEFLREEVRKSDEEVGLLEARIADFKAQHSAALPESLQMNLQNLTRYQSQLLTSEARYNDLTKREGDLVARLASTSKYSPVVLPTGEAVLGDVDRLKALQSEYSRIAARYSPNHPDVLRLQKEINALLVQVGGAGNYGELQRLLQSRKDELKGLEATYSADHPEVIAQRKIVEQLESQLAQTDASVASAEPDNPAYLMLDNQLQTVRIEKESLAEQMERLRQDMAALNEAAANAPAVEREYTNLRRNLEIASTKNLELKAKWEDAKLAGELEAGRKGQRFTLIEPPILPDEPSSPNRPAILFIGFVLAASAGLGIGLLLEMMDGSIRSTHQLARLMGVAPLVSIPYIRTPDEQAVNDPSRKIYMFVGAALVGLVVILLAAHFLIRPLDVLWYEILGKI